MANEEHVKLLSKESTLESVERKNKEHRKILGQGVEIWNQWREKNPETKPDPSKAKLTWAKLSRFLSRIV